VRRPCGQGVAKYSSTRGRRPAGRRTSTTMARGFLRHRSPVSLAIFLWDARTAAIRLPSQMQTQKEGGLVAFICR